MNQRPPKMRAAAAAPGHSVQDFLSGLVWPRFFAIPRIAASASNLLVGTLAVSGLMMANALPRWVGLTPKEDPGALAAWFGLGSANVTNGFGAITRGDGAGLLRAGGELLVTTPLGMMRAAPWATLITLVLAALTVALCGHAIARGTALAVGGVATGSFVRRLRGASRMLPSLIGVMTVPLVLTPLCVLVVEAVGYVLLRVEYLQVVGSLLLFIPLVLSLAVVAFLMLGLLGLPIFIAALACESSDATDALQRSFAYALKGSVRLIGYYALAAAIGVVAVGFAVLLASAVTFCFLQATPAWLPAEVVRSFEGQGDSQTLPQRVTGAIAGWWSLVPGAIAMGYLFSYIMTAATFCYLGVRRVVDGQDMGEVWVADGATAQSPQTRADTKRRREEREAQEDESAEEREG